MKTINDRGIFCLNFAVGCLLEESEQRIIFKNAWNENTIQLMSVNAQMQQEMPSSATHVS